MKQPEFPKVITRGSLSVTIYEREFKKPDKDGKERNYVEYVLSYYQGGERKRETSADYLALRTRADEVLDDLQEGRPVEPGAMKAADRTDFNHATEIMRPTGVSLITGCTHFAKAVEILGGDLVIEAAREYVKRHLNKIQAKVVAEAVTEFIQDKQRQKRSATHVARLKIHLGRFADSMRQNISSVTSSEIDRFLDDLKDGEDPVSARTRDNYADSIVTLYRWAKVKRYVPSDYDEMDRVTRLDVDEDGEIEIYTPEELRAFLYMANAELIPFLAIGAFAGLRSSEILRLDWADVRMENGEPHIIVQKGKVKKRGKSRRIIPMIENLRSWLKPHARQQGLVWPHSQPLLYRRLQELAPLAEEQLQESQPNAKLPWRPNALRHAFISYRVAATKNVAQVALEAGNSPQMIFSNYRELVTEQDAQRWFAIMPR